LPAMIMPVQDKSKYQTERRLFPFPPGNRPFGMRKLPLSMV
jgi:hypothetical protein